MPPEMADLARDRNLAGKDPARDERASKWVTTRYAEFRAARSSDVERWWVRCARAYKMLPVARSYTGRSNLVLPHIRNMVERIVGRVVQQLVGRDKFFDVYPSRWEDEERAAVVRAVLSAQMEEEGYRRETALCVRDAVVLGTCFKKMRWQYDVVRSTVPVQTGDEWIVDEMGPRVKPVVDQRTMARVLHHRPRGERLNPFNLFADPAAQTLDDTDVVEVMQLPATDIFRLVEQGTFNEAAVARALARSGEKGKREGDTMGYRRIYDLALGLRADASSMETEFYPYQEFWGLFPLDAKDARDQGRVPMEQVVVGILGAKEVVRLERNPTISQCKPYVRGVCIEIPGQFYGDTPVRSGIPQWVELNDCRNQSNDARSFIVNPAILKPPTEDKKTSQKLFPGSVITAPPGTQALVFADTTTAAFNAEAVMTRELEETFGAPRLLDAQISAGSATEAAIQKEESGNRILGYVQTLEETMIIPELRQRLELNRQHLGREGAVRIRGASGFEWPRYTPADFMPQYDFVCSGSVKMQARAMLAASFATATDRMLSFEQLAPGMFDWVRWWTDYFQDGIGIEHAELYINPLRHSGRVLEPEEVILLLVQGQRPEPDPRQPFFRNLPVYASYMSTHQLPGDVESAFREYFRKALEIARQQVLERQRQMLALAMGGAGEEQGPAGSAPRAIGPEHRDGNGLSMGRRAMEAARQGAQP